MPEPTPEPIPEDTSQPFAVLVHDDAIDRAHYALVMASSAAALDRKVTVFCAGLAVHLLTTGGPGAPGWHGLGPSSDGMTPALFDTAAQRRGGAGVETLLEACRELGVDFIACEFAARMAGLEEADLRADLKVGIAGAATLLSKVGRDGQLVCF